MQSPKETLCMSASDDSILNQALTSFLAGDTRAGGLLFASVQKPILSVLHSRAADLRHDHDDVLNEAFVLMMEAPTRFNPKRGTALSFIKAVLLPEAIRRVRAKSARPGTKTRRESVRGNSPTFPMLDPLPDPETVPMAGYGSPTAVEAACDAHVIWSRATPPLRAVIGGLLDGKSQLDIASELAVDRFKVARMMNTLRQFANAA
jgi:RNA polymerase sigma-70 factor (ECF subfamily)